LKIAVGHNSTGASLVSVGIDAYLATLTLRQAWHGPQTILSWTWPTEQVDELIIVKKPHSYPVNPSDGTEVFRTSSSSDTKYSDIFPEEYRGLRMITGITANSIIDHAASWDRNELSGREVIPNLKNKTKFRIISNKRVKTFAPPDEYEEIILDCPTPVTDVAYYNAAAGIGTYYKILIDEFYCYTIFSVVNNKWMHGNKSRGWVRVSNYRDFDDRVYTEIDPSSIIITRDENYLSQYGSIGEGENTTSGEFYNVDMESVSEPPLKRFSRLFGGEMDVIHSQALGISEITQINKTIPEVLPVLASQIGFSFHADLSDDAKRNELSRKISEYKIKGRLDFAESEVWVITGIKPIAIEQYNWLLSSWIPGTSNQEAIKLNGCAFEASPNSIDPTQNKLSVQRFNELNDWINSTKVAVDLGAEQIVCYCGIVFFFEDPDNLLTTSIITEAKQKLKEILPGRVKFGFIINGEIR